MRIVVADRFSASVAAPSSTVRRGPHTANSNTLNAGSDEVVTGRCSECAAWLSYVVIVQDRNGAAD